MLKGLIPVALVLALIPDLAIAQSLGQSINDETTKAAFREGIVRSFASALLQQPAPGDKAAWQKKLDDAQSRRRRGQRYVFIGIGVAVVGSVIVGAAGPDYILLEDSSSGLRIVGALTAVGGAGIFWYGVYNWVKGADEVDNLDREGRAKGYLSLIPTKGGAKVALNFSF
jgi:hypothetical protein